MPSQKPSLPQVDGSLWEHSSRGSVPMSARTQVPTLPVAAQVWQVPVQSVRQQTPSEQNPEMHVAPSVHGCPTAAPPVSPAG